MNLFVSSLQSSDFILKNEKNIKNDFKVTGSSDQVDFILPCTKLSQSKCSFLSRPWDDLLNSSALLESILLNKVHISVVRETAPTGWKPLTMIKLSGMCLNQKRSCNGTTILEYSRRTAIEILIRMSSLCTYYIRSLVLRHLGLRINCLICFCKYLET